MLVPGLKRIDSRTIQLFNDDFVTLKRKATW